MKIGLYFGSFNPIHVGHLVIANYIVNHQNLDQVWFVVSPHNPHKIKSSLLEDYHRLALVKEAIDSNPKLRASDIEFGLDQPNYTAKTLAHLKEKYPDNNFSLIMGEDNLRTFHKWYNYEAILENHSILVYPRVYTVQELESATSDNNELVDHKNVTICTDAPMMVVSSSYIRKAIKQRQDVRYLLTPEVLKYVEEMGFYK